MIYGTMLRSYGKGTVDIWLFQRRKDAETCFCICENIWEKGLDVAEYNTIPERYACIEEVNTGEWHEVNKDEWISVNEKGFVHPVCHNIRIVNLFNIPYIP